MRLKAYIGFGILILLSLAIIQASGNEGNILDIYGNANLDGTIDEKDTEYLKEILNGSKEATNLSDANFDGVVDENDIDQVLQIINGTEAEIAIIDGIDVPVKIKKPVERIVVEYLDNAQLVQMLNNADRVVGVDTFNTKMSVLFPEMSNQTDVGPMSSNPDYEKVLSLDPNLLLTFDEKMNLEKTEKLPRVSVVFVGLPYSDLMNAETSEYADGIRKMGYVFGERDLAEDYLNWYFGKINELKAKTSSLEDNEKPTVLFGTYPKSDSKTFTTYSKVDALAQEVELAGGKNIAEDLSSFNVSLGDLKANAKLYKIDVDPEWVIEEDPDIIILHYPYIKANGKIDPDLPNGYTVDDPTGLKIARESFMNRSEYANLNAIKSGNVYIISGDLRNELARGLIGSIYLAKILHPDLFKDLDPEAVHREYLERFLKIDYNLDDHGVFMYPPIINGQGSLSGAPDKYYDLVNNDVPTST